MTKIFITTLLFFLSLAVLAMPDQLMQDILQFGPVDLAYGINRPENPPLINDFKYVKQLKPERLDTVTVSDAMTLPPDQVADIWYGTDFSTEPFDGMVEVLVIGEPLPPAWLTLMLALGTVGIIMWNRKRVLT